VVIDDTDGLRYECIADVTANNTAPSADTTHWQIFSAGTDLDAWFRQASTQYDNGAIALLPTLPTGWYLECTGTGGITSADDLVITSPTVGATVTDGAVVWKIRSISAEATTTNKGLLSPSDKSKIDNIPASGGTGFNHREVITTSGTWTAPTSGYYKVTCIGGGGAGGNGGNASYGGLSGTRGGTSSFGNQLSAVGGHSGGGAGAKASAGGGAAGEIAITYIYLTGNDVVTITVGAGGVAPTSGFSTSVVGQDGSGGAKGGSANYMPGAGAISEFGSGNSGGAYNGGFNGPDTTYPTGTGGNNGSQYGGGGGGGVCNILAYTNNVIYGASGGANGSAGATITQNNVTYPKGGDGGNGAIIIEYFLAE
jgi:hypothetical protein